jgi:hypothetical protein
MVVGVGWNSQTKKPAYKFLWLWQLCSVVCKSCVAYSTTNELPSRACLFDDRP